jgi:hypothetical protein
MNGATVVAILLRDSITISRTKSAKIQEETVSNYPQEGERSSVSFNT